MGQGQAPGKDWDKDYRLVEDGLQERGELVVQVEKKQGNSPVTWPGCMGSSQAKWI